MAGELGTRTVVELVGLGADAGALLRRRGPVLLGWFCAGWAVHQAGLLASALLGVRHGVLATLVFVLAVVAELVALVLMVDAVRPAGLTSERTLDVVTLAVGPFLAVYAVWGFVDDEVAALFRSNYTVLGLGGVADWSISLDADRLPRYAGIAAGGWLLRALVRFLARRTAPGRRRADVLGVLGLVAEGVWALSLFVVLVVVVRAVRGWLADRVVWAELSAATNAVLGALPDLSLPLGTTLVEAARAVLSEAPGVLATVLGLPLMWLALTAVVYGWRDVSATDVVAGTRVAHRVGRWSRLGRTPLGRLGLLATDDLRTKYLPVLSALRLVGRAGPRVVGAYLLLATALTSLGPLLAVGLTVAVGPRDVATSLLLDPAEDLLTRAVVTVASVALYGAVFARATGRELTGEVRAAGPASGRPSPEAARRPDRPPSTAPRS